MISVDFGTFPTASTLTPTTRAFIAPALRHQREKGPAALGSSEDNVRKPSEYSRTCSEYTRTRSGWEGNS